MRVIRNFCLGGIFYFTYFFCTVFVISSCASDEKKRADSDFESTDSSDGLGKDQGFEIKDDGHSNRSSSRSTLTQSLSNNPLTSQTIDVSKAAELAEKMQSGKGKGFFEEKLSAERLGRRGLSAVTATARKIAAIEMEKGAGNSISDAVKLEIALASISAKNYHLAEYLLPLLADSKQPRIKAGALNALGVLSALSDRIPEAVLQFKQALKYAEDYKPAKLNLGLLALKGGDIGLAKRHLGDMQDDWFVQVNMITIARLEKNNGKAGDLCSKVLEKEPDHKSTLFNCSLFELQNRSAFDKARSYAEKASRAKHGEFGWDERIFALTHQIDMDEATKKAQKASLEKAKNAAKSAPNNPSTQQKGGAPSNKPSGSNQKSPNNQTPGKQSGGTSEQF